MAEIGRSYIDIGRNQERGIMNIIDALRIHRLNSVIHDELKGNQWYTQSRCEKGEKLHLLGQRKVDVNFERKRSGVFYYC